MPPCGAGDLAVPLFHRTGDYLTSRVTTKTFIFTRPFRLDEIDDEIPAGAYRVETEEETLDNVSFVAYRRVATHFFLPLSGGLGGSEMFVIHPEGLTRAMMLDRARALEAPV